MNIAQKWNFGVDSKNPSLFSACFLTRYDDAAEPGCTYLGRRLLKEKNSRSPKLTRAKEFARRWIKDWWLEEDNVGQRVIDAFSL